MEQLLVFLTNHWILASAWFLVAALVLLNERARGGSVLSPQQVTQLINHKDAVVVDIRKKEEFRKGHLPNAINIPAASIATSLGQLEPYRDKPVVLVCKTGTTTGAAGATLRKAGFEQVSRLRGGILEWQSNAMPLVKS